MQPTQTQQARAFRSVVRVCRAGLDSVTLREEVGRRTARVVPVEAYTLATVDPDTALFTHSIGKGVPPNLAAAWVHYLYPQEEADVIMGQSRRRETVSTEAAGATSDLLRAEGFAHEMRTVLLARSGLWGFVCMLRETTSGGFTSLETRFMRRIAPHVAQGLRRAALMDRAIGAGEGGRDEDGGALPGVVVLDAQVHVRLRNGAAAEYLEDLADIGMDPEGVPSAVASVVSRLRAGSAGLPPSPAAPGPAQLRARGHSGRWYTLAASLAEPDADGRCATIVLIRPAMRAETARILTRLYGLSRRERETLALAARGESTKRIAHQLGLSPYTVQEHIGRACDKVGVRTRKALIAKLFFDGYAPTLAG